MNEYNGNYKYMLKILILGNIVSKFLDVITNVLWFSIFFIIKLCNQDCILLRSLMVCQITTLEWIRVKILFNYWKKNE